MEFPKDKAKHYPGFTLYPFFHKTGLMPWASAAVIDLKKADKLIFLSGTGRNPETDREPQSWDEERAGIGKVVGGIKEQGLAAYTRIKEVLEGLGARLEDVAFRTTYLPHRDDWWDMFQTVREFTSKNCPDMTENFRAGTLMKEVQLDLPDMRVQIDVLAVTGKKK
ncbi:MAG: RidA family protein [Chloroflexi bacterium]|nr:RidA family protein [Chloroflexota bacterium]